MNLHDWLAFTLTTFLICLSPGPNMLLMMSSGIAYGFRRTFFTMAGCFLGVLILIAGSVAGVGVLLAASPAAFRILCYIGAAYLMYLGVQAWRAPPAVAESSPELSAAEPRALFRKGFLVAMSNPKALLFAAAFFPQFINPDAPELPQLALMLITFTVLEIACYSAYALGGSKLAKWMTNAIIRRRFQRITGTLFIGFGLLVLMTKM